MNDRIRIKRKEKISGVEGIVVMNAGYTLKEFIVNQICDEVDLSNFIEIEFYTWLIWALGLVNS
ncbi:hypothetical protein ES702_07556 [subsurface metagenome]